MYKNQPFIEKTVKMHSLKTDVCGKWTTAVDHLKFVVHFH